jgi:cysteine desulfurase
MLSVSGHKLHAPKGSGFLFVRDKVLLDPLIYGGGQEGGLRSGTQNVPAIAGLCESVRFMTGDIKEHLKHFRELRERLLSGFSDLDGISVNGPFNPEKQAPYIVSLSVKDVRAEVLLHALEEKGIFVGAGSACSSNRPHVSGTLQAMGLEKDLLDKTIRLSFSVFTTDEEIDETVAAMKELVPVLSRYRRG